MKQRILSGWNIRRILYLAVGMWITVQSVIDHQWFLAIAGTYFVAMGIFAFGCAGGNCNINPYTESSGSKERPSINPQNNP